jgi:DNA end-binding protein Ku
MAMLNYDAELRKPADLKGEFKKVPAAPQKRRLAEDLIRNWSDRAFDFSEYKDTYRQKVKQAVSAKINGVEFVAPEEDDEPQIVNLMDALKRSIKQVGGKNARGSGAKSRPHRRRA